ncbi:MAG TPA: HAD-IIIA family hydrolase [Flavihumibacter sp.]|nr:HAD-IIIA family hydrolase [Bacteroidota bacterium]HQD10231.1 HAD-IIIA family hydrolase [Flavihumibacter sp.]
MTILQQFRQITSFVFDVDGVLTDSGVWLLDDGQQMRRMNVRDGYALQLAVKKGYRVLVISGGQSEAVRIRLQKLGINDVYLGVHNKLAVLEQYRQTHGIALNELLFMGDDIPDLEVMAVAGLAVAPADAAPEVRQMAAYISPIAGGHGCVRQIIEKVMKLRGDWMNDASVTSK